MHWPEILKVMWSNKPHWSYILSWNANVLIVIKKLVKIMRLTLQKISTIWKPTDNFITFNKRTYYTHGILVFMMLGAS